MDVRHLRLVTPPQKEFLLEGSVQRNIFDQISHESGRGDFEVLAVGEHDSEFPRLGDVNGEELLLEMVRVEELLRKPVQLEHFLLVHHEDYFGSLFQFVFRDFDYIKALL